MAYDFTVESGQIITTGSSPIMAEPLTLSVWFNRKNTTLQHTLLTVDRGPAVGFGLHGIVLPASSFVLVAVSNDGTPSNSSTTATYSLNTWNHACGVFTSNSNRIAWLNGSAGSANTTTRAVSSLANVSIGGRYVATTPSNYASSLIAECGIWNAALTQSEIVSLSRGIVPSMIRPQSLVFYAPLIRDLLDVRGGRSLTNINNATVSNHPRVYI